MSEYIVIKEPSKKAKVVELKEKITLEFLQGIVKGWIEIVPCLWEDKFMERTGVDVIVFGNEEGKLNGMLPNFMTPYDIIVGPVVAVATNEDGEEVGFSKEIAKEVEKKFDEMPDAYKAFKACRDFI